MKLKTVNVITSSRTKHAIHVNSQYVSKIKKSTGDQLGGALLHMLSDGKKISFSVDEDFNMLKHFFPDFKLITGYDTASGKEDQLVLINPALVKYVEKHSVYGFYKIVFADGSEEHTVNLPGI